MFPLLRTIGADSDLRPTFVERLEAFRYFLMLGEKVHPIITRRSGSCGFGCTVSRKPSQNLRELTGN